VNPYLADLIEAKLDTYDADRLARDLATVIRLAATTIDCAVPFRTLPATFIEPGVNDRWVFDLSVAERICSLLSAINGLPDARSRRLFRVLLGGILVEVSNVLINGKGRRYRANWKARQIEPQSVVALFTSAAHAAIADVHQFRQRLNLTYEVIRDDCRKLDRPKEDCQLAVFSPPYPNSFDYTDVYNLELWMLGYLNEGEDNRSLRSATLASHVQIDRDFAAPPTGSALLRETLEQLETRRSSMWNRRIPDMVGAYFTELSTVLERVRLTLAADGQAWILLGDSRYAGIQIATAAIVAELAVISGWKVIKVEPCRSMRVSAQQGGHAELQESLVVLSATR
jgi:hypothetical protein